MSSLWTPGGEVPLDRDQPGRDQPDPPGPRDPASSARPAPEPAGAGPAANADTGGDADSAAEYERMTQEILDAPAADVISQHLMSLYELAAMHLSRPEPRLDDTRLVIDALGILVEGLRGRLGRAEGPIAEALPQLKMAYVEAADRAASPTVEPDRKT